VVAFETAPTPTWSPSDVEIFAVAARNLIITFACTVRVASMTFSQLEVSQSAKFEP